MSRFGLPQPILYKMPNEDRTLTLEEVLKLYPQTNQYAVSIFSADFIYFNNVFGVTKLVRGDKLVDPTLEDLQRYQQVSDMYLESIKKEMEEEKEKQKNEYLEKDSEK